MFRFNLCLWSFTSSFLLNRRGQGSFTSRELIDAQSWIASSQRYNTEMLHRTVHWLLRGWRVAEGFLVPGVHSVGGTYQRQIGDVMTCYRACTSSVNCAAVDFDSAANSCWFHAGPTACGRVLPAPSTLQIRRRPDCSLPVPSSWRHAHLPMNASEDFASVVAGEVVGDGRLADSRDDDARVDDVQSLSAKICTCLSISELCALLNLWPIRSTDVLFSAIRNLC